MCSLFNLVLTNFALRKLSPRYPKYLVETVKQQAKKDDEIASDRPPVSNAPTTEDQLGLSYDLFGASEIFVLLSYIILYYIICAECELRLT